MPTAGLVVLSESHLEAGVVCVRGRGVPQLSLLHSLPRLQAVQPGQMTGDRDGTMGTAHGGGGRGVLQLSLLHSLSRLQAAHPGQITGDRDGTTGTAQGGRQLLTSVTGAYPLSVCAYPCQPVPTPVSLCLPLSACAYPCQPVPTPVSLCLPMSACAYPCQHVLTSVSRCRARKQAARLRCSLARFSAHGCCSLAGKSRSE